MAHAILQHDKFGKPLHETRPITFVNLQRVSDEVTKLTLNHHL